MIVLLVNGSVYVTLLTLPFCSLSSYVVLQTLLNCLFRLIPFDRLKRCCASKPAILDGLLSYTDRHLNRADRILQVTNPHLPYVMF